MILLKVLLRLEAWREAGFEMLLLSSLAATCF